LRGLLKNLKKYKRISKRKFDIIIMKIYIIDDEPDLLHAISEYIHDTALSFTKSKLLINVYEYVCVIVDRNIIDDSGIDLVEIIHKDYPNAGIIMVNVQNADEDKMEGPNRGIGDYINKPFQFEELNARLLSVKRRRNSNQPTIMSFNEVSVVPDQQKAFVNDKELHLTGIEYKLLYYFVLNKDRVLSKGAIYKHLRREDIISDSIDFIYTHIKNLRKKLIDAGAKDYIKNLYRMGYKFSD